MKAKDFARVGGILMLGMGATALAFPRLSRPPRDAGLPPLRVETSYGKFVDLFPLNIFNKSALIAFGIAGILSSSLEKRDRPLSTFYSRAVFYAMAPLAILGAIPQTRTLFGLWPLYGGEVGTHGLFAALGAYFGFTETSGHWIEKDRLVS
jgi:hypothetical protein